MESPSSSTLPSATPPSSRPPGLGAARMRSHTSYWPEALREHPRREPFPWSLLLRWLLPGCLVGVLLLAPLFLLERQAAKQLAFLRPDGRLTAVQANGQDPHNIGEQYWSLDRTGLAKLRSVLPVMGAPRWSPDGRYLAATVLDENKIKVALFASGTPRPSLISSATADVLALPGSGWSPKGSNLAVIESDGSKPLLSVLSPEGESVQAFSSTVDTRAPIGWHPDNRQILLTTRSEQMTPTLQIFTIDNKIVDCTPRDGLALRSDGTWSPDGSRIAYVAPNPLRGPRASLLAGSIWGTEAQCDSAQALVQDGLNFAPTWAPKGDYLFFTRYFTATDTVDLYRIDRDGMNLQKIGPSTAAMASLPYDRRLFLDWSPDRNRLFFVGADKQRRPTVYVAKYDGSDAKPIDARCQTTEPFAVLWAPTSRALLIACSGGPMQLHWVDSERPDTEYPSGLVPAWQP